MITKDAIMNMENFEEQLRKDLHQFLLSMMNKKQSMKHLMIFAAVIIISGTMVLTSCSDDNPVVVTDDKPWTISADDMDPKVRPGDDFFMYCNGGYWQSTHVREDTPEIESFVRTVVTTEIKNKIADLTLPSLEVRKPPKTLRRIVMCPIV